MFWKCPEGNAPNLHYRYEWQVSNWWATGNLYIGKLQTTDIISNLRTLLEVHL